DPAHHAGHLLSWAPWWPAGRIPMSVAPSLVGACSLPALSHSHSVCATDLFGLVSFLVPSKDTFSKWDHRCDVAFPLVVFARVFMCVLSANSRSSCMRWLYNRPQYIPASSMEDVVDNSIIRRALFSFSSMNVRENGGEDRSPPQSPRRQV